MFEINTDFYRAWSLTKISKGTLVVWQSTLVSNYISAPRLFRTAAGNSFQICSRVESISDLAGQLHSCIPVKDLIDLESITLPTYEHDKLYDDAKSNGCLVVPAFAPVKDLCSVKTLLNVEAKEVKCKCDIKDLLSRGHNNECKFKRK